MDTELFHPRLRGEGGGVYAGLPRPIFVNVGRVAVEKNLEAFLALDLPGSKVIVGDGPDREMLQARHPDVLFTGYKSGEDLARCYADADVFVFPSLTETWGGVMVEALAAGTPVAGFDAPGPKDLDRSVRGGGRRPARRLPGGADLRPRGGPRLRRALLLARLRRGLPPQPRAAAAAAAPSPVRQTADVETPAVAESGLILSGDTKLAATNFSSRLPGAANSA